MQHTIKVEHTPPLQFGLKSAGLGLVFALFFVVSCDFNGKTVPRYNMVAGEKRLPQKNMEFMNSSAVATQQVPAPAAAFQPPSNTYMQMEPQAFAVSQPSPAPVALVQDQIELLDPRPMGFRGDSSPQPFPQRITPATAQQPYNNPQYQHQPGVWDQFTESIGLGAQTPQPQAKPEMRRIAPPVQQTNFSQQDPFAGLPALPPPSGDFPHLREVPEVPQRVMNRTQGPTDAMFEELDQARSASMQAQQMFSGETEIPPGYFQQPAQNLAPITKQMPQGNVRFSAPDERMVGVAEPVMQQLNVPVPPAFVPKQEVAFNNAASSGFNLNGLPPLPAPPAPEYMARSSQAMAPVVSQQRLAPAQQITPSAPREYVMQQAPVAQQMPLAPIQLRRPSGAQAVEPMRLQAPSDPYGTGQTLRSSRYVSRYATRRLQTPSSVY